jgi:predicted dehydrogenase
MFYDVRTIVRASILEGRVMSPHPFRLASIGTGNIARFHRRAMSELYAHGLDSFVITAVCDANAQSAQEAAQDVEERFGVRPRVYTDHQELLRRETLDGVDLCLPVGLHHGITLDCLQAGVPVLCEKPLGITIKAARLMAEAAERSGLILSTAHQIRRQLANRAARWLMRESGLIGDPVTFFHQVALSRPAIRQQAQRAPWPEARLMDGGASLLICGVHYFDTMRYLLGDIDTIYAVVRNLTSEGALPPNQARENALHASITFKSGVTGAWAYWLAAPGEATTDVVFYGSKGSLRDTSETPYRTWCHLLTQHEDIADSGYATLADGTQITLAALKEMYLASLDAEHRERISPHGVTNPMAVEIWEYIQAVRSGQPKVEVDGWEGLKSVACAHAAYESALTGEAIRVDDIIAGRRELFQTPLNAHWGL